MCVSVFVTVVLFKWPAFRRYFTSHFRIHKPFSQQKKLPFLLHLHRLIAGAQNYVKSNNCVNGLRRTCLASFVFLPVTIIMKIRHNETMPLMCLNMVHTSMCVLFGPLSTMQVVLCFQCYTTIILTFTCIYVSKRTYIALHSSSFVLRLVRSVINAYFCM